MRKKLGSGDLSALARPRLIATVLGVIVVLAAWYLGWWSPQGKKLSSLEGQKATAEQKVASLNGTLLQIEHENEVVEQYRNFLTFFGSQVPGSPSQGPLVYELGKLERADDVQLSSINCSTTVPAPSGSALSTVPLQMTVSGPHNNVLKFLSDLYSLPRLITIQTISPSPTSAPDSSYNVLGHDSVPFSLALSGTAYFTGTVAPATPAG